MKSREVREILAFLFEQDDGGIDNAPIRARNPAMFDDLDFVFFGHDKPPLRVTGKEKHARQECDRLAGVIPASVFFSLYQARYFYRQLIVQPVHRSPLVLDEMICTTNLIWPASVAG